MASAGGFVYVSLPALQADAAGCGPGARSARNANARRQRSAVGISLPLPSPSHRSSSIVVVTICFSATVPASRYVRRGSGIPVFRCFSPPGVPARLEALPLLTPGRRGRRSGHNRLSRARGREAWPRSECWAGSAFSDFPARESHAPSRRAAARRCRAAVSATLWPTGHAGTGSAHCAFGLWIRSGIAPRRLAAGALRHGCAGGNL